MWEASHTGRFANCFFALGVFFPSRGPGTFFLFLFYYGTLIEASWIAFFLLLWVDWFVLISRLLWKRAREGCFESRVNGDVFTCAYVPLPRIVLIFPLRRVFSFFSTAQPSESER